MSAAVRTAAVISVNRYDHTTNAAKWFDATNKSVHPGILCSCNEKAMLKWSHNI